MTPNGILASYALLGKACASDLADFPSEGPFIYINRPKVIFTGRYIPESIRKLRLWRQSRNRRRTLSLRQRFARPQTRSREHLRTRMSPPPELTWLNETCLPGTDIVVARTCVGTSRERGRTVETRVVVRREFPRIKTIIAQSPACRGDGDDVGRRSRATTDAPQRNNDRPYAHAHLD